MRNYEKLNIVSFGEQLIKSQDLDPVYPALTKLFPKRHKSMTEFNKLSRWLIAYWCFYHCGFASYASELGEGFFWDVLMDAAQNEVPTPMGTRWPRGHERRHARGSQGIKMVQHLKELYGNQPEFMVTHICSGAPVYSQVADLVQKHTLFGPWISFKICDMIDRVLDKHIDFSEAAVFMFKDPVKAALILWRQHYGLPETAKPKDEGEVITGVVEHLKKEFRIFLAPPSNDRSIGLQEIETILCKWKSHLNGHYPLNNDIIEISTALKEWAPYSKTAREMLEAMPKEMHYVT